MAHRTVVTPPPLADAGGRFQPTYELSDQQLSVLDQFKERLDDLFQEASGIAGNDPKQQYSLRAFLTDQCLCRYLRAREWKLKPAEKLLRGTVEWRREFGVEGIRPDDIYEEAKTGKNYLHGFDRAGRPVIYQRPRRENSKNYDGQVRLMAYILERAGGSMDKSRGVEQHVLFIDFKAYSMFNAPPMHVTKTVMSLLMDRYPERLGHAFMVDAPRLFLIAYSALKPFIPSATKQKVHFVKRSGTAGQTGRMHPEIAEHFDAEDLEEEYGGLLPSTFDAEVYFAEEHKCFKELHNWRRLQAEAATTAAGNQADMDGTGSHQHNDNGDHADDDKDNQQQESGTTATTAPTTPTRCDSGGDDDEGLAGAVDDDYRSAVRSEDEDDVSQPSFDVEKVLANLGFHVQRTQV